MPAREFTGKIIEHKWVTPTVMVIHFEPSKNFNFEPGQFVSVMIPRPFAPPGSPKRLRRIYSIASSPEAGYELSVKHTGGPGPSYLASLKKGDLFKASAPYGDFLFEPRTGYDAFFISTGTGIAPFKSIVTSKYFQENAPSSTTILFGARSEDEIIYPGFFQALGIQEVNAISKPKAALWRGFTGRVTDYLNSLPAEWAWHATDFYLCGGGDMVNDVYRLLRSRGVHETSIHKEVYFGPAKSVLQPGESTVGPLSVRPKAAA